jgi:fructokinase
MGGLLSVGECIVDFASSGGSYTPHAGGAPANVAVQFAKLGGSSAVLSQVGDDLFGRFLIEEIKGYGVDVSHISISARHNTPLSFVDIKPDGDREFSFFRKDSADLYLSEDDADPSFIRSFGILHFGSVDLVDAPVRKAHDKAIAIAEGEGAIVSFDPNLRPGLWGDEPSMRETAIRYAGRADLLKVSDDELRSLTGIGDPKAAAASLFTGKTKAVSVTKGPAGADLYLSDGRFFSCAGYEVEAVDATGAGDSFDGAFLYALFRQCRGPSLLDAGVDWGGCLSFACLASAISVSKSGAMPSFPSLEEVKASRLRRKGAGQDA